MTILQSEAKVNKLYQLIPGHYSAVHYLKNPLPPHTVHKTLEMFFFKLHILDNKRAHFALFMRLAVHIV